MSDGYCKKHYISYCPDLSKGCPYCRIKELGAQIEMHSALSEHRAEKIDELEARIEAAKSLPRHQTPMAPDGVLHVWADDLEAVLKEQPDE